MRWGSIDFVPFVIGETWHPSLWLTILALSCISIVKVTRERDVGEMGDVTGVYCFPGTHPICPKWGLVMSDLGNTNALQRIKLNYLLVPDPPHSWNLKVLLTHGCRFAKGHPNTKSANTNGSILTSFCWTRYLRYFSSTNINKIPTEMYTFITFSTQRNVVRCYITNQVTLSSPTVVRSSDV